MESIRRQLAVPPYVSVIFMAFGLGMLAVGIALVAASSSPVVLAPEVEVEAPAPAPEPRAAVAASEQAAPIADEIKLVFSAGGASYLRLADLERDDTGAIPWPRHAAPRLVKEGWAEVAIAAVAEPDVPAPHRTWAGRRVVIDGTCQATVAGFAVVSRLIGEPAYAGLEKDRWDVAAVMQSGAQVLAARLDGCSGTFARDAALPPVVTLTPIRDERLARAARSALIASPAAAEAKRSWDEAGLAPGTAWWEHAALKAEILRHPRTGATLVTVHARADHECGGPEINVWAVYRVTAEGALSPVHELQLESLEHIDRILDIEGDGELELIGRSWLGTEVVLAGADGRDLDRLPMPFYGCPC